MKLILLLSLVANISAFAQTSAGKPSENLTTLDGKAYTNLREVSKYPKQVYFTCDQGRIGVAITNLPDDFQLAHGMADCCELLKKAVEGGNLEKVKSLLTAQTNAINCRYADGWTLLHSAAIGENSGSELVKLLLADGADVNSKDNTGATPLHNAAFSGNKSVAEALLASGADVNAKANDGRTPLLFLIEQPFPLERRKDVAELLLAHGADVNAKDNSGNTPFQQAESEKQSDVVRLLLAHGAYTNNISVGSKSMDYAIVQTEKSTSQNVSPASKSSVLPKSSDLEIISLKTKVMEANELWWRWSYQLTVKNNTGEPIDEFPHLQFLDADRFIVAEKTCEVKLSVGETKTFLGTTLVELPGAARVKTVKVE